MKPVADAEHERDDVAAVGARVLVVCLDDVAEQQRGALVGVVQLGHLLEALVALAREVAKDPEQRCDEEDAELAVLGGGRERNREPER